MEEWSCACAVERQRWSRRHDDGVRCERGLRWSVNMSALCGWRGQCAGAESLCRHTLRPKTTCLGLWSWVCGPTEAGICVDVQPMSPPEAMRMSVVCAAARSHVKAHDPCSR